MKNIKINIIIAKTWIVLVLIVLCFQSCKKSILDKQPLSSISDATFWKTSADAKLALTACYRVYGDGPWTNFTFWTPNSLLNMDLMAGNGSEKESFPDHVTDGTLSSSYFVIGTFWSATYKQIATCNNFLDHIGNINMDAALKAKMTAEARTIRAYDYFNLALYFGNVPLIEHVQTVAEANSVTQSTQAQVWAFCVAELKESAVSLPHNVADADNGHITSAAALAVLGRIQMAQKQWADAAISYKTIMDYNYYIVEPKYRELFFVANELSHEFIMTSQYIADSYQTTQAQFQTPEKWGGWHQYSPFNELVEDYECTDGKTIDQSPLYDKNNPYNNRDPRLDATIMISDRTVYQGGLYTAKPGTTLPDHLDQYPGIWSGYSIYKFLEDLPTNLFNDAHNGTIIRYPEVLLGYLESVMEAGNSVNQTLLDQTINKVRGRASVHMPPVTTTDPVELRKIIRRERRVEFAFEGLRYYDCLRWGIIGSENNKQFTGMKLTNNPSTYTAFPVNNNGYYIFKKRSFITGKNELWPIPQSEININKNLKQNPGY